MTKELYNKAIKLNLKIDKYQLKFIELLESYKTQIEDSRKLSNIILSTLKLNHHKINGIYVWGEVGRGKSIISNIFYQSLAISAKKHFHFHQFILEIHKTMNAARKNNTSIDSEKLIEGVIKKMLPHCKLLFLDELQINNITDLVILNNLFKALKKLGTFTIITSNRAPSNIFTNCLNNELITTFIDLIDRTFDIFHLEGSLDYRSLNAAGLKKTYFHPLNKKTAESIDSVISEIVNPYKLVNKEISIDGRSLRIHRCYKNTAVFEFSELCEMPLGASDYIAIAHQFKNIILLNIPRMKAEDHNHALRFITLIDCLYENKTRLVCSADADIDHLYTGTQNKFEFARTISRLKEMSQPQYLSEKAEHILGID